MLPLVQRGVLFTHRDFVRLWAGDGISQLGTQVTAIAVPLLAVTTLDASSFQVGVLAALQTLAYLLIGLPTGVWIDRMHRRPVLIAADLGRFLALGSIPLAAVLDGLTIWQLYAVVLLHGVCSVFFDVAYQSYLPSLVGTDHLIEANAKLQGTQSVALVAGPSLGGVLAQAITPAYTLLVDAVSFLWSASWLRAIRHQEPAPESAPRQSLRREIGEGLRYVAGHRLIRPIATCTSIYNLSFSVAQPMLIVLLARHLDLPGGVIGALLAAGAVGGLLGAIVARRVADRIGIGRAIWIAAAASTPLTLVQPFLQRDWTLGLFVVTDLLVFCGGTIYSVNQLSLRQVVCPPELLGRMNATLRFLLWGVLSIGGLLGGGLAAAFGVRTAILIGAIGMSLAAVPLILSPLRDLRELPEASESHVPRPREAPVESRRRITNGS